MKVHELVERLQQLDPELEVILSQDAEGNGYSAADALDIAYADPTYNPNEYARLEDLLFEEDFSDEDSDFFESEIEDYKKVAVIWPV